MRADPLKFAQANEAVAKSPRFIVTILFETGSLYITSHAGIPNVPGIVLAGHLQAMSAISQRIVPDEGRSEIGEFSFQLVDIDADFTDEVRTKLNAGVGLRGKTVQLRVGFEGFDYTEFQLFQTQIITGVEYDEGVYRIRCADIVREQRKDIFEPKTTTLQVSISATDTTITVKSTNDFAAVAHGTGWSDAPSQTVFYFRIEDEIIRATGKTTTTFTGCTRGVFNTKAAPHAFDGATPEERRPKVEEFIYLELPAPKLAYAVLTGVIHGTANVLPAHWHLGIPTTFVRLADFENIGTDLWNTADDTAGFPLRFEGLKKEDGQRFLERQIYALLMAFQPVYSDGTVGLQRLPALLPQSPAIATITEREVIRVGSLTHNYERLHNVVQINWAYDPSSEEFRRRNLYVDSVSTLIHGTAEKLELDFRGLQSGIHTDAMIEHRLDALRDGYSYPPVELPLTVMQSLSKYEVADVVRVQVANLRDFTGPGSAIDRAMMIMRRSIDFDTGDVSWETFGSTRRIFARPPTPTPASPLPDGFYNALGTALNTVIGMTGNSVNAGSHTINGGTDMNAAPAIFYHLGDLTIPDGATITITGNVQLRIRGFVTLNGDIDGTGGGLAGVADPGGAITSPVLGNPGFMGASRGWDGVDVQQLITVRAVSAVLASVPAGLTQSKHQAKNGFPELTLEISGTSLLGLPSDMRGTGGGPGGRVRRSYNAGADTNGGTGAAGGAGLIIVCRGMSYGASSSITLDGANPATTSLQALPLYDFFPGAGGAGAPGAFLTVLDGNALSIPNIGGRFFARAGTVPVQGVPMTARNQIASGVLSSPNYVPLGTDISGYQDEGLISGEDLSNANFRILYAPESQTPNPDVNEKPPAPTGLIVDGLTGANIAYWSSTKPWFPVELWASSDNNRANATKVGEVVGTFLMHSLPSGGDRYYWVRARNDANPAVPVYSDWYPVSATAGVPATSIDPLHFTVSISPTSDSESAASGSNTFSPANAASVNPSTGTISYAWGFQNQVGGSFSISAGQGTASATVAVSGVAAGATATAELYCDVTRNGVTKRSNIASYSFQNTTVVVTVSVSPTLVSGTRIGGGSVTTTTPNSGFCDGVVSPSGGTFSWRRTSGDSRITPTNPTSQSTKFSATLSLGEDVSAVFVLDYTYNSVVYTSSNSVTVNLAAEPPG